MKILLLNGSPRPKGSTTVALDKMEAVFAAEGLETERVQVGNRIIRGCIACGRCAELGRCVFDDPANELASKLEVCDGLMVGSPVCYASANATLVALLTRLFYSTPFGKAMKVGAAVAAARRGGLSSTFDELDKFFTINDIPVASSQYWNSIRDRLPGKTAQDAEGLQAMRILARNMALLVKSIALGREKYGLPEWEEPLCTHFIRWVPHKEESMELVVVIGADLAGPEAAWQLAQQGVPVTLREMKPSEVTPAHHTEWFGELVCSNSLRSDQLENVVDPLKEELRRMDSLILSCANAHRMEAGGALAVDRHGFTCAVTEKIRAHLLITVEGGEVTQIPESGNVIVASGSLISDPLAEVIRAFFPESRTPSFYDAATPLVTFESMDIDSALFVSRYDRGIPNYINCPTTEEEYDASRVELCTAQEAEVHGFEDKHVFEGCMPVEVTARRGEQTLCYGPLKPRGLNDPKAGKEPFAMVQLRRDNADGTIYNLVGFQTRLKWPEQRRVFSMIPALRNAEFVRYGVTHRNAYLDSPWLLDRHYRVKKEPRICFAGQITGVKGCVESTAPGFPAAVELARRLEGKSPVDFLQETAVGALACYVSNEGVIDLRPMDVNFGIIPPPGYRVKDKRNKNIELSKWVLELLDGLNWR